MSSSVMRMFQAAKARFAPRVSIILPVLNRAGLIREAVDSVLDQSYADLELIVVDDGSTDGTSDVLVDVRDGRLRLLQHAARRGANAARNTGLRAARGAFIGFQDSDNTWVQDKLAKQMAMFREAPDRVGVVYCPFWLEEDRERRLVTCADHLADEGKVRDSLLEGNFVTTSSAVVRRECFESAGEFDESLKRLQEWDLWLRIAADWEFRKVDEPLVTCRILEDSISKQESYDEAFELIRSRYANLSE